MDKEGGKMLKNHKTLTSYMEAPFCKCLRVNANKTTAIAYAISSSPVAAAAASQLL